ncbi:ABC transporter ATP-binding protein [Haematospirillum jordaniae]|nr:ABC transporter ATP-binding protein [Haematospirillum jordaniae]NKD45790.1 ABC transporter ATP-binding protein [Haematospirillum jordaniae]NKD57967.1 ABC transporter ATP-binding protein [Haematospirillum jordaniae]NKD60026.1 ABC transporter ATP-binding protein [Haematospirillum jordaniae]NKD67946.1 ABC transporter ATP-binding protein [Haematospirillum jordaniae]NKD80039.1 ABC transporter ATP-binding protein [Haematospirillum jordaniae]
MSNKDNFSVRVEGLSKRYVVPHRDESRGRMGKIAAHMREFFPFMGRDETDYFWSLRDVSFEVKPGEILGILGRNGSGKSTLLKILSGVTQPTTGRAELRGRVGSLLEVGTGFHPDLTGRENVFMSGVLLGLSRKEIAAKFDEIVDFSGIEQFIDVPVKRYSSGMYVRLAYTVASLLRSDILILDEVMAVGDAAFLEKSQKNIEKIANDGRTILFVSHNIHAVRSLCHTAMLLSKGQKVMQGEIEDVVSFYMRQLHGLGEKSQSDISDRAPLVNLEKADGWDGERLHTILQWVETCDGDGNPTRMFKTGDSMCIRIGYQLNQKIEVGYFTIFFIDDLGDRVQVIYSLHDDAKIDIGNSGVIECRIDDLRLVSGEYSLTLDFGCIVDGHLKSLDCIPDATQVRIDLGGYLGPLGLRPNQGTLAQRSRWCQIDKRV